MMTPSELSSVAGEAVAATAAAANPVSAVVQVAETLPKLIDLGQRLAAILKTERFQSWLNDLEGAVKDTENAQSAEDFQKAAARLVGVVAHIS